MLGHTNPPRVITMAGLDIWKSEKPSYSVRYETVEMWFRDGPYVRATYTDETGDVILVKTHGDEIRDYVFPLDDLAQLERHHAKYGGATKLKIEPLAPTATRQ